MVEETQEETIIVNPVEEGKDTLFPSLDIAKFEKQMKAYNSYSALNKFRNETGLSPSFDLNTLETLAAGNLLDLQNYSVSKFSIDFAGKVSCVGLAAGSQKITGVLDPTADQDAATKKYVDDNENTGLWEVDGTETQLKTADEIDMRSKKIINLTDPTTDQHAATKKYVDDNKGTQMGCTASDTLKWSADIERTSTDTTYTKYKEILISLNGTVRTKFDLKSSAAGILQWGRIYVNGIAVGQEEANATESYVTKTTNSITVKINDLVQLYLHKNVASGGTCYAQNFRIYYTTSNSITEGEVITD